MDIIWMDVSDIKIVVNMFGALCTPNVTPIKISSQTFFTFLIFSCSRFTFGERKCHRSKYMNLF